MEILTYRINDRDIITHLSDNWLAFAERNGAAWSCHPSKVIGGSLWQFVDGAEATHLYELITHRVRQRGRAVRIPFRCDSPDERRYLEMEVSPCEQAGIEFRCTLINSEKRASVLLLESVAERERSEQFVTICSMCKKIAMPDGSWLETEAAVAALKLFELARPPQLTHGLCPFCYEMAMAAIDKEA